METKKIKSRIGKCVPVIVFVMSLAFYGCGGGGGKTAPTSDLSTSERFATYDPLLLNQKLVALGYTNIGSSYGAVTRAFPKGIAIEHRAAGADRLWVANTFNFKLVHPVNETEDNFSMIAVIDLDTKQLTDYIMVKSQPVEIVFDGLYESAYVIHATGYITKIDAETHEVVKEELIGSALVDIVLDGNTAYISDRGANKLYILSQINTVLTPADSFSANNQSVDILGFGINYQAATEDGVLVGATPTGIAFDSVNRRLFVTAYYASRIYQYNIDDSSFAIRTNRTFAVEKGFFDIGTDVIIMYAVSNSYMPITDVTEIKIAGVVCDPDVDNGAFELDPHDNSQTITYYCEFDSEYGMLMFFTDSSHTELVRGEIMHKQKYVDADDVKIKGSHYQFKNYSGEYPVDITFDTTNQRLYAIFQKRSGDSVIEGSLRVFDMYGKDIYSSSMSDSETVGLEPTRVALSPTTPWVVVTNRLPLVPDGTISLVEVGSDSEGKIDIHTYRTLIGGKQPWDVKIDSDGYTGYISNIESQDIIVFHLEH